MNKRNSLSIAQARRSSTTVKSLVDTERPPMITFTTSALPNRFGELKVSHCDAKGMCFGTATGNGNWVSSTLLCPTFFRGLPIHTHKLPAITFGVRILRLQVFPRSCNKFTTDVIMQTCSGQKHPGASESCLKVATSFKVFAPTFLVSCHTSQFHQGQEVAKGP